MSFVYIFAVYFIIWWTVFFVMLPFGLRTQDEDDNVTLGTTSSAPAGAHMGKVLIRTTVVSAFIYGAYFTATSVYGWRFDDIPQIGPGF